MTRAEQAALKAFPVSSSSTAGVLTMDGNYWPRTNFIQGYHQAEKDLLAKVKEYMEKGARCMQQSYEDREPGEYTFWDGFHNCAENILRELEK